MPVNIRKIVQIVGDPLIPAAIDLVVAEGGQLENTGRAPARGLVLKVLPVGRFGAGVGHVPGKQQHLGMFFGDASASHLRTRGLVPEVTDGSVKRMSP